MGRVKRGFRKQQLNDGRAIKMMVERGE